jgi:hypothetical protein
MQLVVGYRWAAPRARVAFFPWAVGWLQAEPVDHGTFPSIIAKRVLPARKSALLDRFS